MIGLIFWLLTVLACGYAALFGGKDGRWIASLIVLASILTVPASLYGRGLHFGRFEPAVFAIDFALLAGLYAIALSSRRWWPLWMTAFHLIAVASHLSALVAVGFIADVYFGAAAFWAVPMSVVLLAGVMLDQRAALRQRSAAHDHGIG